MIFEKRAENLGVCLPGFGIVFAVHENAHKRCTIASPLEVALNALSQEISKDKTCNLQLFPNIYTHSESLCLILP